MTLRRRLVDWALTGVLILVPALVLRASLSRGTPSLLDEALLRITAPLETSVSWLVEGIGGTWSRYVALVDVEAENRELREETGLPVMVCENPQLAVVLGTGKVLDELGLLREIALR